MTQDPIIIIAELVTRLGLMVSAVLPRTTSDGSAASGPKERIADLRLGLLMVQVQVRTVFPSQSTTATVKTVTSLVETTMVLTRAETVLVDESLQTPARTQALSDELRQATLDLLMLRARLVRRNHRELQELVELAQTLVKNLSARTRATMV